MPLPQTSGRSDRPSVSSARAVTSSDERGAAANLAKTRGLDELDGLLARAVRDRAVGGRHRGAGRQAALLARVQVTGGITPGAQGHHPKYEYAFAGDEPAAYDLDAWITKKAASPVLYASNLTKIAVDQVITGWNTAQSIFVPLNATFVGAANWNPRIGQPGAFDTTVDVPGALGASESGKLFAKHFLTLQANVELRERDIPNNVPQRINVSSLDKKNKTTNRELQPNWTQVLEDSRTRLKAKLQNGTAPPATKEQVRVVDEVVLMSTDPALKELRTLKLVENKGGQAKFSKTSVSGEKLERATNTATLVPDVQFNFGLNHLKFIIYLEWRALIELRDAAS